LRFKKKKKEGEGGKGSGITRAEKKGQVGAEATEGKKVKKEKVSYLYDMNWKESLFDLKPTNQSEQNCNAPP